MALQVGEIYVALGIKDSGFNKGMSEAKRNTTSLVNAMGSSLGVNSSFTSAINQSSSSLSALGMISEGAALGIAAVGVALVAGAVSAGAFASKAIAAAGTMEQTRMAFTGLLGDAEQANIFINQLQAFAAATPFEFSGIAKASQRLMAMGIAARDVIPTMTALGDAASAMGAGPDVVDRLVTALGQMSAKGKVSGEEMRQFAEAGIPVWDFLANKLSTDVAGAMKKVESGAVDAKTGIDAIKEGMESSFGGMMKKQSQTLFGRISTLKDAMSKIFIDVGEVLLPMVKPILEVISEEFKKWPTILANVKVWIAGLKPALAEVGNALKPLWDMFKQLQGAMFTGGLTGWSLAFKAFGLTLKGLVPWIRIMVGMIQQMVNALQIMAQVVLATVPGLSDLLRFVITIAGIKNANMGPLIELKGKQDAEAAAMAKEEEAKAVLEGVEAIRKQRQEEAKQRQERVAWMGPADLWKKAMAGVQKSALGMPSGFSSDVTLKNKPSDEELRKIKRTLDETKKGQDELIRLTRQALGAV